VKRKQIVKKDVVKRNKWAKASRGVTSFFNPADRGIKTSESSEVFCCHPL
jgi:hypothetical protein